MSDKPKKKNYKQKFREEWLDEPAFANWLAQDDNDPMKAYCNFCSRSLVPKYSDLLKHGETLMHQKAGMDAGIVMKKTPGNDSAKKADKNTPGSESEDDEDSSDDSGTPESESDDSSSDDSVVAEKQKKVSGYISVTTPRIRTAPVTAPVNNNSALSQKRKLPAKTPEIEALRKKALRTTVMAEKEKQEYYKLKQEAVKLKIKKLEDDLGAAEINKETQSILKKAASFEYNRKTNGN